MKSSLFKKTVFVTFTVLIIFCSAKSSYAQLIYGFKAGYGMSKLTGSDLYGGINWKYGFSGGAIVGYKFRTDFSFQSEILFEQAGMNQKFTQINRTQHFDPNTYHLISDDSNFKYDNSLNLNYLKVPLFLKKSFSFKGGTYPFLRSTSVIDFDIFAGPYVSYLISSSANMSTKVSIQRTDNGVNTTSEPEKAINDKYHNSFKIGGKYEEDSLFAIPAEFLEPRASISKGLNKLDVGITIGLGMSFELSSRSKLTFDARYSMGLLSIDKEYFANISYKFPAGTTIPDFLQLKKTVTKMDLKNTGIQAFVGYIIYLD